jgi:hypothetical protein
MRYAYIFILLLIGATFGCADGCSCGGSPAAPVVPESAGGADEFIPATPGANEVPAEPVADEPVADEPVAEEDGSGQDPNVPHQLDPNQHIQGLQPPTMQLHPITPGRGGNLPNRVSPSITNQQVRQAGPTPSSVDPAFVTE